MKYKNNKKLYYFYLILVSVLISMFLIYKSYMIDNFSLSDLKNKQYTTWAIKELGITNFDSESIKIAILDSGINDKHPELKGKVKDSYNAINPERKTYDDNGHGTAIAGIIASENNNQGIIGASPNAVLFDVKVLDASSKMTDKRWPGKKGWVKMQRTFKVKGQKTITIHFNYNKKTKKFDDFKFK